MELLAPIIVNISTCLYSRLPQQLDYLKRERENVRSLVTQQEELSSRKEEVLMEIENVKMQTGKKLRSQVMVWLNSVEKVTKEVHEIEFKSREAMGCCKGCFPNCFLRLKLSKQAAKKIEAVSELLQKGRFTDGLFGNLSESRMTLPTSPLLGGTAEKTKEKIWECLMDVNVAVLGVYGIGGVGKTTIMTHIYNQLIEDSIFDSVIWVTVSKASTLEQLQNNIAKSLDLELSKEADEMRRSQELFAAFKRRKKFVLILDDMWIAFPLEKVGIPKPDQENGCKLVLTTRLLDVCHAMESQRAIKVEILTAEEAWKLFKDKVGHDFSPEVEEIAKLVLRECGGLPLAIITVGRSMREKKNIRLWRNALNELKGSKVEIQGMEEDVFTSLKFSYVQLRDKRIKDCFLYCALYPEDLAIPTKDLIEHWMGEELIEEVGDMEAEMDKGHTILDELMSACMLEGVPSGIYGERIKMHDLIRDMAIDITRAQPLFIVRAGVGLKDAPKEDEWFRDVERISLMRNNIQMLSGKPICPYLSTLLLQENRCLKVIHDGFFEHMQSLRVLDLSYTMIESLPESVSNLENLRLLSLHYCYKLKKLPMLAKLKALRMLDLYYTPIEELPQGMEALTNLRCLNLSWTYKLQSLPAGVFLELSNLEDLRMYGNQWRWSSNTMTGGARIEEFKSLRRLANLSTHIADLPSFLGFVNSRNSQCLKTFHLMVGASSQFKLLPSDYAIEIHGCDLICQDWSLVFPDNTRVLGIYECNIIRLSQLFCLANMRELKECFIYRCDQMEYILMENEITLSGLEMLDLRDLPKVHALYKGVVSHDTLGSLKNLHIRSCSSMKNIFSLKLIQHLQKLEQIKVHDCDLMEEIIEEEKEICQNMDEIASAITLPNLKKLSLNGLCVLKSICKRKIICSSLHTISIRGCPQLKNIPFSIEILKPVLKKIKGEKEWWDALEWDDTNAKALLQPHFMEIVE